MTLRGILLSLLTVTLSLGVTTAPAHAGDQRGCVSQQEYNDVQKGWRQARVADHFDTIGTRMTQWNSGGNIDSVWKYRKCSAWGPGGDHVGVWFDNYTRDGDGNHFMRVNKKVPNKPGRLAAHVDDLFG
jgi:hypothetical protein